MNYRKERFADKYRSNISKALNSDKLHIVDTFDLFRNGNIEHVQIDASRNGLSLYKKSSYTMIDNVFTNVDCDIEEIIYDLATFLQYKDIERILNLNLEIIPSKYYQIISTDEDRGYISFVLYRDSERCNLYLPDKNDKIKLSSTMIQDIADFFKIDSIDDLLEEYDNLQYQE